MGKYAAAFYGRSPVALLHAPFLGEALSAMKRVQHGKGYRSGSLGTTSLWLSHGRPREQKLTLILAGVSRFTERRREMASDRRREHTGEAGRGEEAPEGQALPFLWPLLQPRQSTHISSLERQLAAISHVLRSSPSAAPVSHQNCPGPSGKAPAARQGPGSQGPASAPRGQRSPPHSRGCRLG